MKIGCLINLTIKIKSNLKNFCLNNFIYWIAPEFMGQKLVLKTLKLKLNMIKFTLKGDKKWT